MTLAVFDLVDWLGDLTSDTVRIGLIALAIGIAGCMFAVVVMGFQRAYYFFYDRYGKYGLRRQGD